MYLMSMKDVLIDEYFLCEYTRCQLRAFMFCKSNYVTTLCDLNKKKDKKYRAKKYIPHDDTLKYKILKAIYYKTFSMIKGGINFEQFKELAILITEKEIKSNKKKAKTRSDAYFDKIQKNIFKELEDHFNIINEYDMSESIEEFVTLKANLKKYLEYRRGSLNPYYNKLILEIKWEEVVGEPFFLLNFINIKKDDDGISVVMTSPLNIRDEMTHRNFYISFVIQYIYYFFPREKIKEIFGEEYVNVNKLIVYYPLTKERKEYTFKDVNGVFQEIELLRILFVFLNKLAIRTLDTTNCKHCENKDYCFHRTNARNSTAQSFIFNNATIKKII